MRFTEFISEAGSPGQQAAIAIAMKKAGKKPKSENIKQGIADEGMFGFLTTPNQSNKQVKPNSEEMRQYFAREKSKESPVYNKNTTQKPQQVYTKHMEEEWSKKYKSSINCSHPKGFSQKAHCAGKKKHNESMMMEMTCEDCGMCQTHGDHSKDNLDEACWSTHKQVGMKNKGGKQVPNCVPKESTEATETEQVLENLHKWFKEKWVRFGPDGKIRGDCARGSESEGKPKCLPQSKAHSLGKKGRASAAARKRREDPNANRSGKAINVSTKGKGK